MRKHVLTMVTTGFLFGVFAGGLVFIGVPLGVAPMNAVWPAFCLGMVVGVAAQHTRLAILATVDNRTSTLRRKVERLRRDVGDIHGIVRLGPYLDRLPLPFGGGWALTGDAAALIAREVLLRRPRTILELGSGVSTLLLGQILAPYGGRLLSIDHDPIWAEKTATNVRALGLDATVRVIHAPLVRRLIGGTEFLWYDLTDEFLASIESIDALVVDGPPHDSAAAPYGARYPALPMLRGKLAPDAIIFIDDAARDSERMMVEHWQDQNPEWTAEHFDTVDGMTILTRRAGIAPR